VTSGWTAIRSKTTCLERHATWLAVLAHTVKNDGSPVNTYTENNSMKRYAPVFAKLINEKECYLGSIIFPLRINAGKIFEKISLTAFYVI
jgi:hypothetical protein